jgi:1-phosphofructokinase family hexose kinase
VIVCAAANPSIDRLFEVERLRPGGIHRPTAFTALAGGKGLNVARAVACLGDEVHAVALVGGNAGRFIAECLQSEGIAASFAWCQGETRSSLSTLDRSTGLLTEFYEQRGAVSEDEWADFERAVSDALDGASWLTLSGSLPPGAPEDGYARLIARARAAGVRAAIDSRGEPLAHGLVAAPDVVKVNLSEAEETLGTTIEPAGALAAAITLAGRCASPPIVSVVTLGARGAVVADAEGGGWEGQSDGGGVFTVGSGDAFLAGLIVGLERGDQWPRPLALALGAGAANAEVPGAGSLTRKRAELLADGAEVVPAARPD